MKLLRGSGKCYVPVRGFVTNRIRPCSLFFRYGECKKGLWTFESYVEVSKVCIFVRYPLLLAIEPARNDLGAASATTGTKSYKYKMDRLPQPQQSGGSTLKQSPVNALDLSLGVEFEFLILKSYPKGQRDTHNGDKDQRISYGLGLVSSVLEQPIQVPCSNCEQFNSIALPLCVQKPEAPDPDYHCWNIASDASIKLKDQDIWVLKEKACNSYAVEVISQILFGKIKYRAVHKEANTQHEHPFLYQQEIEGVLNLLKQAFNSPGTPTERAGEHFVINNTCSFHVHIGNRASGFPLQTVKNVLCISTAFERLIDSMHARSRIGGSRLARCDLSDFYSSDIPDPNDMSEACKIDEDVYNTPLTQHLISSAYVTLRNDDETPEHDQDRHRYPHLQLQSNPSITAAARKFDTMSFIRVIQQAPTLQALQELFGRRGTGLKPVDTKKTNINILNLSDPVDPVDPKPKNTIEFRQHAGVATPEEALPWVDFVLTLVQYAHKQNAESINSMCEKAAIEPNITLKDMFDLLGLGAETQEYYLSQAANLSNATTQTASTGTEQSGVGYTVQTIVARLAAECKTAHSPGTVSQAVRKKFRLCGYGQFSRIFIEEYVKTWSEEDKKELDLESLVIGYQAEAPKFDELADVAEEDAEQSPTEDPEEGPEGDPDKFQEENREDSEEGRKAKRLKSDDHAQ